MITFTQGLMKGLLASCVLSLGISAPSFAGDGVIVTGRNVQAHMIGRPAYGKDPYSTTANANPSQDVMAATGELSDRDFGNVSSGSSIVRVIQTNDTMTGLHATQGSLSTLGAGSAGGHGSGSGMGGQISDSIQRGMAPLNNIGSMMGGKP